MIYPTRRAGLAVAAGAPLALIAGSAVEQLWVVGPVWAAALLLLMALDAMLAAARDGLTLDPVGPLSAAVARPGAVRFVARFGGAAPRSLVLFDEPEMHLHPPLAAALMHSVRLILEESNAVCVVATHSPVILQETMARHVRVVQRVGEDLHVKQPKLETFGENIGILTYDTFGLTASSSDFHLALDQLADGLRSVEQVDSVFSPGLSSQARAYVLGRLAAGEKKL